LFHWLLFWLLPKPTHITDTVELLVTQQASLTATGPHRVLMASGMLMLMHMAMALAVESQLTQLESLTATGPHRVPMASVTPMLMP